MLALEALSRDLPPTLCIALKIIPVLSSELIPGSIGHAMVSDADKFREIAGGLGANSWFDFVGANPTIAFAQTALSSRAPTRLQPTPPRRRSVAVTLGTCLPLHEAVNPAIAVVPGRVGDASVIGSPTLVIDAEQLPMPTCPSIADHGGIRETRSRPLACKEEHRQAFAGRTRWFCLGDIYEQRWELHSSPIGNLDRPGRSSWRYVGPGPEDGRTGR